MLCSVIKQLSDERMKVQGETRASLKIATSLYYLFSKTVDMNNEFFTLFITVVDIRGRIFSCTPPALKCDGTMSWHVRESASATYRRQCPAGSQKLFPALTLLLWPEPWLVCTSWWPQIPSSCRVPLHLTKPQLKGGIHFADHAATKWNVNNGINLALSGFAFMIKILKFISGNICQMFHLFDRPITITHTRKARFVVAIQKFGSSVMKVDKTELMIAKK